MFLWGWFSPLALHTASLGFLRKGILSNIWGLLSGFQMLLNTTTLLVGYLYWFLALDRMPLLFLITVSRAGPYFCTLMTHWAAILKQHRLMCAEQNRLCVSLRKISSDLLYSKLLLDQVVSEKFLDILLIDLYTTILMFSATWCSPLHVHLLLAHTSYVNFSSLSSVCASPLLQPVPSSWLMLPPPPYIISCTCSVQCVWKSLKSIRYF